MTVLEILLILHADHEQNCSTSIILLIGVGAVIWLRGVYLDRQ
mgnify:CR=1 FL=1